MTVGETQEGRTDRGERKKERESARKGERAGRVNEEESEKERRSQAGDYRPRRRLVYGSADAHHLLKKTCCSKCVHFACAQASLHRPVGATKSPIVSHSTFTFGLGRERKRKRTQSPLVFRQTPATEGDDCLATTINLSSRLFRDYKFYFERATRKIGRAHV